MKRLDETAAGVFIICVTPFKATGELDLTSAENMVEFYLARGATGLTLLGMMGEAPKLTVGESVAFVECVLARVAGRVPVVVGLPNAGLASMAELSTAVMAAGAAGVMVAPPSHLRSDAQIRGYFTQVAMAIGKDTPFVLQDFPLVTTVTISPQTLMQIIADNPNCVMLKHEDWPGLNKLSELRNAQASGAMRPISILVGNGGMFLPDELARGANGAMTGFAYPEMMAEVLAAWQAGAAERARDLFDAYLPLVRYEQQPGLGLAVRKHILALRGAIACATLRLPAPVLSAVDIADIEYLIERQARRLQALG
ncbi:dihydrodipicolinate synthase family protein [Pseudomonas typographi]|uniref:Dihydrodipicolinate synthase family protein n=1 Tax=Pseudomonas typographi TaxID=2715964 RepID=A0ABR7Z3U6_9PSED|nr:dihydrodipicolinate synthase family protein [Pseudomonas typographi]MBD1600092.1 dihydrodipicolinate synthase family protein [Pseudomonas typographi]